GAVVKDTEATIGADALVDAADEVSVRAESSENMAALAANAGFGLGSVAVVGSLVSVNPIIETEATIGERATVDATGNVVVSADSDTRLAFAAGNIAGGGDVAVAAANVTVVHIDDVSATIADGAEVTARGQRSESAVYTGERDGVLGDKETVN